MFENAHCLVTGGTGLIGRQVVRLLCDAGAEVVSASLDDLSPDPRAKYVKVDLRDYKAAIQMCTGKDYVFHIAGIKSNATMTTERPASFFVPLLQMNTSVLAAAHVCGVRKLVYTSSIGVYSRGKKVLQETADEWGAPMDLFPGWAKRMGELQCRAYAMEYGLDYAVVRPSNVYGPGDNFNPETAMVVGALMGKALRGDDPVMVLGNGSSVRDYLYSEDAARGIIAACPQGTRNSFVNLGGGTPYSVAELVNILAKVTKNKFEYTTLRSSPFSMRVLDISRAREWLDWQPEISLEDGINRTWSWFNVNYRELDKRKDWLGETN